MKTKPNQLIGQSRRDLTVYQNNILGDLVVSSQFIDANGAGAITKLGAGILRVTGLNTTRSHPRERINAVRHIELRAH